MPPPPHSITPTVLIFRLYQKNLKIRDITAHIFYTEAPSRTTCHIHTTHTLTPLNMESIKPWWTTLHKNMRKQQQVDNDNLILSKASAHIKSIQSAFITLK